MNKIDRSEFHTAVTPLSGRRILITGGTTGIGRATAGLLAAEGAKVFVFGRERKPLDEIVAQVRELGGTIEGTTADVAKPKDVDRVVREAVAFLGGLDVLINNAGIGGEGIAEMDDAEWRYVVDTNLTGFMAVAKISLEQMKRGGHMVFIGSVSAEKRGKDSSVYVATKAAIQAFADSFRKEVSDQGIKVTLIEPGKVGTDMTEQSAAEQRRMIEKGELLRAEDLAVAIHYVLTQPERCEVTMIGIRQQYEKTS
jgi:NADP-dependent 3-hydroxy acid dehydrogenase YdfG